MIATLGIPLQADAYLCGPVAFMAEMGAALVALGFEPSRIHTETFGAVPAITPGIITPAGGPVHPPPGPSGHGPGVSFARSSLTVKWNQDYGALLELADACNVPVRWLCRTGVCYRVRDCDALRLGHLRSRTG